VAIFIAGVLSVTTICMDAPLAGAALAVVCGV
jgi:hypothetical protein